MIYIFDQTMTHQQHIPFQRINPIFHDKYQNDEVYMDDQHYHESIFKKNNFN
jgi:hypothetical protein